jgi:hypothetical protein
VSWWRRKPKPDPQSFAIDDAERRLQEAQERLARTQQEGEQVAEVAEQMRALRRRNQFGPMISDALRGSR